MDYPSEARNQPRNGALGAVSDALKSTRDVLNYWVLHKDIPWLGGHGIGDFTIGKMPEELNDWSYGNAPFKMPEQGYIPFVKPGRKGQLFDTIVGADILGGLTRAGGRAVGKGIDKAASTAIEHQAGRREFLKKTGALTAVTAAGGAPLLAKMLAEKGVPKAAVEAAVEVAVKAPATMAEKATLIRRVMDNLDYYGGMEVPWGEKEAQDLAHQIAEQLHKTGIHPNSLYNHAYDVPELRGNPVPWSKDEIRKVFEADTADDSVADLASKMIDSQWDVNGRDLFIKAYPEVPEAEIDKLLQLWNDLSKTETKYDYKGLSDREYGRRMEAGDDFFDDLEDLKGGE